MSSREIHITTNWTTTLPPIDMNQRLFFGQESDQERAALLDDRCRFWWSFSIALIAKREQHLTYNPYPIAIYQIFWLCYRFKPVVYIADSQAAIDIGN